MSRASFLAAGLASLVLGGLFGVWGKAQVYPSSADQTLQIVTPIPVDAAESALIERVYADASGEVVEKTTESFVVKESGQELTLHVVFNGLTTFVKDGEYVPYETLGIGDRIRGGVSIENVSQQQGGQSYEILAHQITIESSSQ